ncbi:MAG: 50S ribosomal protein L4 [Candidatus Aenigmarchaeota archaeon]|nr:50S ribosomal protein L4 [Candidatus Aenigmarchaeota archaeon]MCK5321970.1 50S ribosomal protein L4 [Candidatus Aenigmarchaeota archaeon]
MKADVISLKGEKKGSIDLPDQFEEIIRPDLVKRSVLAIENNNRQPYGTNLFAGLRTSAQYQGRRASYGTWANRALHRTQRIRIGSGYITGRARKVPGVVKGRKAHPPKTEKIYSQKINKKENRLAIRSCISATAEIELVTKRGHELGKISQLPLIIETPIEKIGKTKDLLNILKTIGISEDIERCSEKKIRSGKGTMRGRKHKIKTGALIVVEKNDGIAEAAGNILGIDVIEVTNLNAKALAPGTHIGRLTIWSESAIEKMKKEKLFI